MSQGKAVADVGIWFLWMPYLKQIITQNDFTDNQSLSDIIFV